MKPLITGSRGYIGSTLAKTFVKKGIMPVGVDKEIRPNDASIYGLYYQAAFEDPYVAEMIMDMGIDTICHLAADASVPDSVLNPGKYYHNNVSALITFANSLVQWGWKGKFIFSSSAAVYSDSSVPVTESSDVLPCNPYGQTKLIGEHALRDIFRLSAIELICFRYFNVAGAWDDVGDHSDSSHVIQRMCDATYNSDTFKIFGKDLNTPDGTCIRDFIHVRDVCDAHLHVAKCYSTPGSISYNLGTGNGISVYQLLEEFNNIVLDPRMVSWEYDNPRIGDPIFLVADGSRFTSETGYTYKHSNIKNIIQSSWDYFIRDKNERI